MTAPVTVSVPILPLKAQFRSTVKHEVFLFELHHKLAEKEEECEWYN